MNRLRVWLHGLRHQWEWQGEFDWRVDQHGVEWLGEVQRCAKCGATQWEITLQATLERLRRYQLLEGLLHIDPTSAPPRDVAPERTDRPGPQTSRAEPPSAAAREASAAASEADELSR